MWLAQNGMTDPNNAGAGAYAYMQLMGLVSLGWMWLKMANVSARLKDQPGEDAVVPRNQDRHRPLLSRSASWSRRRPFARRSKPARTA